MLSKLASSPRLRRRAAWTGVLLVAAGAAAGVIVLLPKGEPLPPDRLVAGPAVRAERQVKLTPSTRRAINQTIDRFVPAAVSRRNPAAAWELAGPGLRAGTTRRDWGAGDLPVVPFPAGGTRFHGWQPLYAYRDRVGFDLLIQPRAGVRRGPIAFSVDVVRRNGRWLVDTWYPTAIFTGPDEKPWVIGSPDFTANYDRVSAKATYEAPKFQQQRLDTRWLLLPLGLLASAVLAAATFALVVVRRNRRALGEYRRQFGDDGSSISAM